MKGNAETLKAEKLKSTEPQLVRVRSLEQLIAAALTRRSVVVPSRFCYSRPIPAAVVQNMQARLVHRLIEAGMFLYEPKGRR